MGGSGKAFLVSKPITGLYDLHPLDGDVFVLGAGVLTRSEPIPSNLTCMKMLESIVVGVSSFLELS